MIMPMYFFFLACLSPVLTSSPTHRSSNRLAKLPLIAVTRAEPEMFPPNLVFLAEAERLADLAVRFHE